MLVRTIVINQYDISWVSSRSLNWTTGIYIYIISDTTCFMIALSIWFGILGVVKSKRPFTFSGQTLLRRDLQTPNYLQKISSYLFL